MSDLNTINTDTFKKLAFVAECEETCKKLGYSVSMWRPIRKTLFVLYSTPVLVDNIITYVNSEDKARRYFDEIIKNTNDNTNVLTKFFYKRHSDIVKQRNYDINQLRNEKYENERFDSEAKIFNKYKDEISYLVKTGVFRSGILVSGQKKYEGLLISNDSDYAKYVGCQLINNPNLDRFMENPYYYSSGSKNLKSIKFKGYKEHRYGSFEFEFIFIKYPHPLSIYLNPYGWSSIENSFMQCFMSYVDTIKNNNDRTNEDLTFKLRRITNVFSNIDSLLQPPISSQRTTHGAVVIYKQGLFTLKSIYDKTNDMFKKDVLDILSYFEIDLEMFVDVINNN